MSQTQRVSGVATRVFEENGMACIQYHFTNVVSFNGKEIVLNTGGWYTVTTKTRMNQASNEYDLGFYVFQKNSIWYVSYRGETIDFYDGMILTR